MESEPARAFVGYAGTAPHANWPDGARLAVNFVLNVEEGSEPSVPDGDGYTENRLTDSTVALGTTRDLAAEGLFEYGSRSGFFRIHREFQRRSLPLTVFACALALERNPAITVRNLRRWLRRVQSWLPLDQPSHPHDRRGTRADPCGGRELRTHPRLPASRLVLPLRAVGEHAAVAR